VAVHIIRIKSKIVRKVCHILFETSSDPSKTKCIRLKKKTTVKNYTFKNLPYFLLLIYSSNKSLILFEIFLNQYVFLI